MLAAGFLSHDFKFLHIIVRPAFALHSPPVIGEPIGKNRKVPRNEALRPWFSIRRRHFRAEIGAESMIDATTGILVLFSAAIFAAHLIDACRTG